MKVKVKLVATDLDTKEKQVLADTAALYDGKRLLYKEDETGAKHEITLEKDILTVKRTADITSITQLHRNGSGSTSIVSEYGIMELDVITETFRTSSSFWCVEYRVDNHGAPGLHQRLEWHIDAFV